MCPFGDRAAEVAGAPIPSPWDPADLPEPLRECEQCECRVRNEQDSVQRHEDGGHTEEEEGDAEDAVVGREHEQRADAATRRTDFGAALREPEGSR